MRAREFIIEKIVYRDPVKLNPTDWLNTVVAINPSKSEFWSANFRQDRGGETDTPEAAGVILKDGTVVVGTGHGIAHDDICRYAGLNIDNEWVRLQIANGEVRVEIWIPEDIATSSDSLEQKIEGAEQVTGMSIADVKQKVSQLTSRFVPGWKVICMLWTDYSEYVELEESNDLDEMALPADWDPTALGHDKSFKSRLEYALQRARRLGGGSSRVAFAIPDQGRETVLKIAKNKKGLAQNEAEVDVLSDGYVRNLDIVIPLVDYDKVNASPVWLQTELAQRASEAALCKIMKCGSLEILISYAANLISLPISSYQQRTAKAHLNTLSEEDAEDFVQYAGSIAELLSSTSLKMYDFNKASNWGIYKNKPVLIDLGFTEEVSPMYARNMR